MIKTVQQGLKKNGRTYSILIAIEMQKNDVQAYLFYGKALLDNRTVLINTAKTEAVQKLKLERIIRIY